MRQTCYIYKICTFLKPIVRSAMDFIVRNEKQQKQCRNKRRIGFGWFIALESEADRRVQPHITWPIRFSWKSFLFSKNILIRSNSLIRIIISSCDAIVLAVFGCFAHNFAQFCDCFRHPNGVWCNFVVARAHVMQPSRKFNWSIFKQCWKREERTVYKIALTRFSLFLQQTNSVWMQMISSWKYSPSW